AIQITAQVTDLAGNPLSNPTTSSFTVDSPTDNTSPSLLSANPPSNSTGVGVNVIPTMTFSERMIASSFNSSNTYIYEYQTGVTTPSDLSLSADRLTVSFIPKSMLKANTGYYYYSCGPTDLAGRTVCTSVYFVTGTGTDTIAPTVTGVSPANGATFVQVNA